MAALWIVKQFPRQIRRDLDRFHQRRLGDWWRGTRRADGDLELSSSELLDYLEWMDEEGAFKTQAERGGRWPTKQQMWAEMVNEAYRFRSSYFAVNGGEDAVFDVTDLLFVDPVDRELKAKAEAEKAAATQRSQSNFESDMGFT